MAVVLWLVTAALLVLAIVLGPNPDGMVLRAVAVTTEWVGPVVLVLAVVHSLRRRWQRSLRRHLVGLAGPALVRAMPPRVVLDTLLNRVFGGTRPHKEIVTGLLGGAGRDPTGKDTAVSSSTAAHFQVESVSDTECISYLTWTHEYSGVRNNHRFVIFATSDREIARLVSTDRVYPLYEVWTLSEEALEDFVPALRETLRAGITYRTSDGQVHVVPPRPQHGEEVAFSHYDQFIRLPDHLDRKNLRILQLDLYDLAADDHVVEAVETLTIRASNVAAFDLGYLVWSPPHPCFVRSVTFDVSRLAHPGEDLVYLVVLGTIKGAGLPIARWQPLTDLIEVPVESWMLSGHNVTLLYRPITPTELPHALEPD